MREAIPGSTRVPPEYDGGGLVRFYIPERDETIGDAREVPGYVYCEDHDSISASFAAEYYHDRCDGWARYWPLVFVLVSDDGKESTWKIDRRMDPVFHASEVI
jgi:hypothetical protein